MPYTIVPLLLARVASEKGAMTYLCQHGRPIVRPYVCWYLQGGDKKILIDTAIEARDYRKHHPAFQRLPFEEVNTFANALQRVGCTPDDIDIVIQTHLHLDHMYNTRKCKNATVYVQEEELRFALDPHPIFQLVYPTEMVREIKFEQLRGDATILPGLEAIWAPGHTPGCQAVAVETPGGRAIITGCCTIMDNFAPPEEARVVVSPFATSPVIAPGIHTDLFQAYNSAVKLKSMADIIIPMHDPGLAQADSIP